MINSTTFGMNKHARVPCDSPSEVSKNFTISKNQLKDMALSKERENANITLSLNGQKLGAQR